ncbi:tRNA1(Val) (adenine(37)-N6)-methyltransferase [Flagellimonas allohymeniacidonis]|uniref:tRNA1(Val) (adenine(37)-N6)-methyltransferase n=1 Tax=Flagellimonas allohymeniacidonis TaxID=2517819 RepID=A0A4Q8QDK4_9FLAO|nr:methyltransferase [Allomuricauda hymeniacidonis]TAI47188.1 methyltransferase domain-containing protein [Allomuricauda hymeniacidonis]
MSKPFHFKQFTIHQDRCAMKIGTDGVLLGAWTSLEHNPNSILDIGAGTGLIALQMAQRSGAEVIDAIEIEEDAYEQCVENFEASLWSDRLFCYHAGLDEFVEELEEKYDLIVSNPPFYSEEVSSGDVSRDKARQSSALPFDELLEGVSNLLSPNGRFTVIIPFKEEEGFVISAQEHMLHLKRITRVKGNSKSEIKRVLMEFCFEKSTVKEDKLTIEKERHQYTEQYVALTRDFYLKM